MLNTVIAMYIHSSVQFKNIAWTKWPIKMKFGWPLQKLIGHYKFECLVNKNVL